jgi:hypothetical protein
VKSGVKAGIPTVYTASNHNEKLATRPRRKKAAKRAAK